ncbi:MAG: NAD-dependent epimerase/dehydratase family protein [Ginsengibacter sp.]
MRALVTGATGLIGNHLVRALLSKGNSVKALVRATSNVQSLPAGIELAHGDILEEDSLRDAARGCDIIFHAAGTFAYWGYDNQQFIYEAKKGMECIIIAAAANNIKRVVFTSSSVTIGASERPDVLTESSTGNFNDAPGYVIAKIQQEETAFATAKKYGVEVIAVCPTLSVGGPDSHLTESNRMIVNYINDPYKSTWIGGCNIVSADDVADAMLLLAEKGKPGERYIAGSDNLEWKEVHAKISELCGMPGPYLTAMRTSSYLLSAVHELWYHIANERPTSTREQAKMVGKYYWYNSEKLIRLGWQPMSSEAAIVQALSWLVTSLHISPSVRAAIHLHDTIYAYRKSIQAI